MTPKSAGDLDPLVVRLQALAEESRDLKEAATVYRAILPLLRYEELHVTPVSLTREQARASLKAGSPLLSSVDFEIDIEAVRDLMIRLACALESFSEEAALRRADAARAIRLAIEADALDISSILSLIGAGERCAMATLAHELQLDPNLLWTLGQNALKPALRTLCRALSPLVEGVPWDKGYCFICGAGATLGELQQNDQIKHLRCGQCGADWPFRRLHCMYCGNEDHRTLSYLYEESRREKMRIEVCDKCKGYLKVIASFAPTPPEMLPVEDLATLHLDHVAEDHGYARVAIR